MDTHDHPVREEVWALYERTVGRVGAVPTLIEWDDRIPDYDRLEAEALRARRVLQRAARGREAEDGPKDGPFSLGEVQRSLARWIREPEAQPAEARGGAFPRLEDVVRGDARTPAAVRLAVYVQGYSARIRDVLQRDLPAVAACLGADGFHDLVKLYLLACPSGHPSLRFAGARLPTFLADHPAAAAPFRRRWPFAPDLARLEWALLDAFDAADADVLERRDVALLRKDAFEELRFFFHPSVGRLSLGWQVQGLLESVPRAQAPPAPEPTEILVWRQREEVRLRVLAPDEARALDDARAGASFGALCAGLATALGDAAAPGRAAALLAAWLDDGLLRSPA